MRRQGLALWCLLGVTLGGCTGGGPAGPNSGGRPGNQLTGEVICDGSSTVAPVTTAMAEEFSKLHTRVRVPVGTRGTGGGFKKFCAGEIDVCNASRHITESEIELCQKNGIEYLELKICIDGLTVAVHPQNDWVESLSIAELKTIWEPGSTVTKWSDVNPDYPSEKITLFGPDTDSGTFEYFTEVVCGKPGASRSDYQQSADDNFLVIGVSGDKFALGYFGYAYYKENQGKLKAVGVSTEGGEAVAPTPETIESGEYTPLSRPLLLYVNKGALARPEAAEFLRFYLSQEARPLIEEVGYVPLSEEQYAEQVRTLEEAIAAAGQQP